MRPHHRKPGRRGPAALSGALIALALAPAAADARPPRISQDPVIAGDPQVGATLQAQGAQWNGGGTPSWQWMRCDDLDADDDYGSCRPIDGATATDYAVTAADQGRYLRVLLEVRNKDGSASALSPATAAVAAAPAPSPEPSASPSPSSSPSPSPEPSAQPPAPVPAVEVGDEQAAAPPRMMSPAPVVRIRGHLTPSGARITLLTVRAPRGARIVVRCSGRRCPARRWARTASLMRVPRFEQSFPAGTRLVISVTKRGRIGKHTAIAIRRGKAPTRLDRCLMPGSRRPVRCPGV